MTSKDLLVKMQEIEARNPLTIEQILKTDMLDYKEQTRKQAIKELSEEIPLEIIAVKIDDSNSVFLQTNKGINVWVDVWLEDGEITADWNKYIFYLDNEEDVKIKKFQEDISNFEEATSIAISFIESKNIKL